MTRLWQVLKPSAEDKENYSVWHTKLSEGDRKVRGWQKLKDSTARNYSVLQVAVAKLYQKKKKPNFNN